MKLKNFFTIYVVLPFVTLLLAISFIIKYPRKLFVRFFTKCIDVYTYNDTLCLFAKDRECKRETEHSLVDCVHCVALGTDNRVIRLVVDVNKFNTDFKLIKSITIYGIIPLIFFHLLENYKLRKNHS